MYENLEDMIEGKKRPNFKSKGERRIARFLDTNSIKYQYESGVLINDNDEKFRIWYPDFHLPEFGTYIEYYGIVGQENYDNGIRVKESVYSKMAMDVIPVYPWMFAENWQDYIMQELERSIIRKYKKLKTKPYWSKQKTCTYHNAMPTHCRHGQRLES